MISIILIIFGIIFFITGIIVLLYLNIHKISISTDKDEKSASSSNVIVILIFSGIILCVIGCFMLNSDNHGGLALYNNITSDTIPEEKWDKISDDGKYISASGREFIYYIVIRGKEYEFNGEICEGIEDVKTRLSQIKKENTIMIVDSYAAAAAFRDIESILQELGINYEVEEL